MDHVLTEKQKEAVGQVMADAFTAHIQSGWDAWHPGVACVGWQHAPGGTVYRALIDPDGTVTYK